MYAPEDGPNTCAVLQQMVYKPAYCPLLAAEDLLIQKVFINGIDSTSPTVQINIEEKANSSAPGNTLNMANETPVSATPQMMY